MVIGLMINEMGKVFIIAKLIGTMWFKNGDKYIGGWVNDKMEGNGICQLLL